MKGEGGERERGRESDEGRGGRERVEWRGGRERERVRERGIGRRRTEEERR